LILTTFTTSTLEFRVDKQTSEIIETGAVHTFTHIGIPEEEWEGCSRKLAIF
jgi:hypothetical protein